MTKQNRGNDRFKKLELQLENQNLAKDIEACGGITWCSAEMDPQLQNQFLKNILAFEKAVEQPPLPVRSLFADDFQLPPADSMSADQIDAKLAEIEQILIEHNIELSICNDIPAKVLYKYLAEEYIPNETTVPSVVDGFIKILDGCTGDCANCFQEPYCDSE